MTYSDFCDELAKCGITDAAEWRRLDSIGRHSAIDALGTDDGSYDRTNFSDWNSFHRYCAWVGRVFILDNLYLFGY